MGQIVSRCARGLMGAIDRIAHATRLLVASDFDGVLAPIVDDPEGVVPISASVAALSQLADIPDTFIAIVSGRDLAWLRRRVPNSDRFALAGSHGVELEWSERDAPGPGMNLARGDTKSESSPGSVPAELAAMVTALTELARRVSGLHVEVKPLSVAAHLRRVPADQKPDAVDELDALVSSWSAKVIHGKEVVEFSVATATKGDAITAFRDRCAATAVFYAGDDTTDEDVFAVLGPDDVGIKVGDGHTLASHRVAGPSQIAELLEALARARISAKE